MTSLGISGNPYRKSLQDALDLYSGSFIDLQKKANEVDSKKSEWEIALHSFAVNKPNEDKRRRACTSIFEKRR